MFSVWNNAISCMNILVCTGGHTEKCLVLAEFMEPFTTTINSVYDVKTFTLQKNNYLIMVLDTLRQVQIRQGHT